MRGKMKTLIGKETPILDVLRLLSPDSSRNNLKSWLQQGRVSVNGRLVWNWSRIVASGEEVKVRPKSFIAPHGVKILFEDEGIVVIEKPPKLLSVATEFHSARTAHAVLKQHSHQRVWPVHRLDKETSGVLVFAYTEKARDVLKKKFESHDIEREYHALLEGVMPLGEGIWKSFLVEDDLFFVKSSPHGKEAITHYSVLSHNHRFSLVRFKLETGRKNQIRVHASEAGFPIVGDFKYGGKIKSFNRMCLHASLLIFEHPLTGKKMRFVSPLPSSFRT